MILRMRAQRPSRIVSSAAKLVVSLACLAAFAAGVAAAPAAGNPAAPAAGNPAAPAAGNPAAPTAPAPTSSALRVGGLTLTRCDLGLTRPSWCGTIHTPLDWADPASARIPIAFGWVPASATATGTVVAQEGGPGYPSTGTAVDYARMLGPLLAHRNLLLMDQRGTGRSGALNCPTLQTVDPLTDRFAQRAAACADQLNHTYRDRHGHWMHASDLFTTANSVRDLAELITALRIGKVDYYGDSYGTYFGQSFITHFPQLVRSAVLDSAYETVGLDPWYRTTITTARAAFDKVCERALGCPAGSSWMRIAELAALLRAHPVTGQTVGVHDTLVTVTVDVRALVNIINDAGYDTEPYRELDAAVRAYLDDRDAAGLLRLWARDIGWDYSDYVARPSYFSDAQYMAVACTDYPQLFSMRATPTTRAAQLDAAIRRLPAGTFAPFSTREWLSTLNYTEAYTGCLDWPAPTHPADPPVTGLAAMRAAHVPTLVLNGQLDSLTPAPDGQRVADQLGSGYARAVVAANTVHLVALANPNPCGATMVRAFIATPARPLDTACAATVPPIRAVPAFSRLLADVPPAYGRASLTDRRLAAVAVAEAGDAAYRYDSIFGAHDRGLRGGRIDYSHGGATAVLAGTHWTIDTAVSGTLTFGRTNSGTLTISGAGGLTATVQVSWSTGPWATAIVHGALLTAPAP